VADDVVVDACIAGMQVQSLTQAILGIERSYQTCIVSNLCSATGCGAWQGYNKRHEDDKQKIRQLQQKLGQMEGCNARAAAADKVRIKCSCRLLACCCAGPMPVPMVARLLQLQTIYQSRIICMSKSLPYLNIAGA
jgi:hypothetical protein